MTRDRSDTEDAAGWFYYHFDYYIIVLDLRIKVETYDQFSLWSRMQFQMQRD
jgi:hypothetical protein